MRTWHSDGNQRGLRQLTLPVLNDKDCVRSSKQLFDSLAKFCPRVEYVDGYKVTLNDMNEWICQDTWLITLNQWEQFNAACTELREFHWAVVPFADPYFRVFGEHTKPHLTKLTFAVNTFWDWQAYFHVVDEAAELDMLSSRNDGIRLNDAVADTLSYGHQQNFSTRPGYGCRASDVSSALKGCPSLSVLQIALSPSGGLDEMVYNDPYGDDDTADMEHAVHNIDIYDDEFCAALVKYCPLLTSLSIMGSEDGLDGHVTPIRTFTDQGLVALAKLKYLTMLQLRAINCTGNGVFQFLDRLSDQFVGQQTFQVCIGAYSIESRLAFYNALLELLMQLKARNAAELAWENREFVLRLMNCNLESVEPGWSEQYLCDLERALTSVKELHPNLRFRVTTSGRRGQPFESITEFGLYTANANPSPWYGWDAGERDSNASFVNRDEATSGFGRGLDRLPLGLRHPELLDPDSLPIDYELPDDYFDDYGGFGDYSDYGDHDDYDDYENGYFNEENDGYYDGNADEFWL
ncbi:unnamed protein product [Hyaloperonospora brassicae]|uniref:Uncharacterized protein n=1 Tax=Hyaloperonospora brassicae TaxID=162125 RepID=A0AAV0TGR0_HYABA|nr:unnamed protein product [Hyaloperonospora brassicae]